MSTCSFCDKKGLLIYPVRYAVACPAGASGVPALSGHFKVEDAPQDIGTAKYTLRALRAGYLYTYDERRSRLKAYMVLPKGHLWNFPIEFMPPRPEMVPFSCIVPGEIVRAHCVDIPHTPADPATNLWIGWSSVLWTKALVKKVGDAAWRKKHMQCINVPAMLAGSADHTGEFKANSNKIAHFAADGAALRKAFSFSNTNTFSENAQHLWAPKIADIMAAQAPHNKGFIIAVNDPVGITNDLSELVVPGLHAGFDEKMYRGHMVAELLKGTEKRVRAQARSDVEFSDEVAKNSEGSPDGDTYNAAKTLLSMFKAGGPSSYAKKQAQDKQKYGTDLAGRQQAASDNAWKKLTHDDGKPLLDEERLKAFSVKYDAAIATFEPISEKLVRAHFNWFTSKQLANWMEGVHDESDLRSGYAYSESVAQCIGKAVDTKPCKDQLNTWLNSETLSDASNLYSRALLFNQKAIISAAEPQLKGSDIQFENILNIYKDAYNRVKDIEKAKLFDRLALTTFNIMLAALQQTGYGAMRFVAFLHFRLLSDVAIKANNISSNDLAKWAVTQAKAQRFKLETDRIQTRADGQAAANEHVKGLPADRKLYAYELDIVKLEKDGRITPGAIKEINVPGVDATKRWLGSSAPDEFHLGVVTGFVQALALGYALKDWANNDQFNERETRTKAAMASVSLLATIGQTMGETAEATPAHPLAVFLRNQWAMDEKGVAKLASGGRFFGAVAGIIVGVYDIWFNARDAFKDGNEMLGWMYRVNGALGIGIALAAAGVIGFFWPLFLLSFVVGIAIALISSGLMQQWISRCYFAKGEQYDTLDAELKAYNHAVGA